MNSLPTAADVVLANAVAAQAESAPTATAKPKNDHWINIYANDESGKIGAFPIDARPGLVTACQSDVDFAQAYWGGPDNDCVRYVYQQSGVSSKPKPEVDVAAVMAKFRKNK
jgi:hypothetical protein